MIERIGVIYQDKSSFGFLRGVEDRLNCRARLLGPPSAIGKTQCLSRNNARNAWRYFSGKGVDLVVRFTDADGRPWKEVRQQELSRVPSEARSLWICGVTVNNTEDWLALDTPYIASHLQLQESKLGNPKERTGIIKHAILQQARGGENPSDVVRRIVVSAPPDVFRKWLTDASLRAFYTECRNAARQTGCETPNELSEGENA